MLSKIKKHPIATTAILGGSLLYTSLIAHSGWVRVVGTTGVLLLFVSVVWGFVHIDEE